MTTVKCRLKNYPALKPLKVALPNRFFAEKGLFFLLDHYELSVTTT
jgi:hypothetical protein